MSLVIVAAVASNGVIGDSKTNKIPWDFIPEDIDRLRQMTMGSCVIMGRKTLESLGANALQGRKKIIVSKTLPSSESGRYDVFRSLQYAIKYGKMNYIDQFILGGGEIYQNTIELADQMELTLIHKDYEGDVFFPKFSVNKWHEIKRIDREGYSFCTYHRLGVPLNCRR